MFSRAFDMFLFGCDPATLRTASCDDKCCFCLPQNSKLSVVSAGKKETKKMSAPPLCVNFALFKNYFLDQFSQEVHLEWLSIGKGVLSPPPSPPQQSRPTRPPPPPPLSPAILFILSHSVFLFFCDYLFFFQCYTSYTQYIYTTLTFLHE